MMSTIWVGEKLYSVVNTVEEQKNERPNERMSNLCTSKSTLHLPNHTVCIPNAKNTNQVYQKGEQLRF